jgi:hypothetical protein
LSPRVGAQFEYMAFAVRCKPSLAVTTIRAHCEQVLRWFIFARTVA